VVALLRASKTARWRVFMRQICAELKQDWSLTATVAGFVAVLISYSGPLLIFFQAAQHAQLRPEMMASWIWAISIGAAIPGILLSIKYKVPVITAWSAPGTALLVSVLPQMSLAEMVAAYLLSALLLFLVGISGAFDLILRYIPQSIAAGMMAGILFQFGVGTFIALEQMPMLCFGMLLVYSLSKRLQPQYCMLWVLLSGLLLSWGMGQLRPMALDFHITQPLWTAPQWHWATLLNLAIPLFLVSLSGQFLPGMALFKLNHYQVPSRPVLTVTSLASLAVAGFGGINIVLASMTAALCMSEHCHPQPAKRYIAGISNGLFYLLGGLFAGSIVAVFSLLPKALVATLAGLALLGAISQNLTASLANAQHREAALMCFLCTASGIDLLGMSSVLWGIVLAMLVYAVQAPAKKNLSCPKKLVG
jgi:benzoate membrane transport protein